MQRGTVDRDKLDVGQTKQYSSTEEKTRQERVEEEYKR